MNSFWKFIKVSVWLLGLNGHTAYPELLKLGRRIERLVKLSGFTFTVQYLKEALRLCQKALAGEPTSSSQEPRVASRRGLPLIIPGSLRLRMEAKDIRVIRAVLTLVSVFRVMPSWPKLKLETITGPHTGALKTLPDIALVLPRFKRFMGVKARKYFEKDTSPFVVGRRLLTLTTAGPNQSCQLLGYPIDALALSENPSLLDTYRKFCLKTSHRSLWLKLDSELKI